MHNNLKPITSRAQARTLGRKGGSVRSKKKSEAARLREIRKRSQRGKSNSEDKEWLLARLEDPFLMSFDILMYLDEIKKSLVNPSDKIRLANAYIKFHELIHKKNPIVQHEPVDMEKTLSSCIVRIQEYGTED
jgi:hypothetical protein